MRWWPNCIQGLPEKLQFFVHVCNPVDSSAKLYHSQKMGKHISKGLMSQWLQPWNIQKVNLSRQSNKTTTSSSNGQNFRFVRSENPGRNLHVATSWPRSRPRNAYCENLNDVSQNMVLQCFQCNQFEHIKRFCKDPCRQYYQPTNCPLCNSYNHFAP